MLWHYPALVVVESAEKEVEMIEVKQSPRPRLFGKLLPRRQGRWYLVPLEDKLEQPEVVNVGDCCEAVVH
jgi:hypothetical protein